MATTHASGQRGGDAAEGTLAGDGCLRAVGEDVERQGLLTERPRPHHERGDSVVVADDPVAGDRRREAILVVIVQCSHDHHGRES